MKLGILNRVVLASSICGLALAGTGGIVVAQDKQSDQDQQKKAKQEQQGSQFHGGPPAV